MRTIRQALETASKALPPGDAVWLELAVRARPKNENPRIAAEMPSVVEMFTSRVVHLRFPPPAYECVGCGRRIGQPTFTRDEKLRFNCPCSRRAWTRPYDLVLALVNATDDPVQI